jgi:hypothetical protein
MDANNRCPSFATTIVRYVQVRITTISLSLANKTNDKTTAANQHLEQPRCA